MTAEEFADRRAALANRIWGWLEDINKERNVNWCEATPGRLTKDGPFYTDCRYGEVMLVEQSYQGARMTVEGEELDPDRMIQIAVGHTEDWAFIISILSSVRDRPIDITYTDDAVLRAAIHSAHDEIFADWPLSQERLEEIAKEILRRRFPE